MNRQAGPSPHSPTSRIVLLLLLANLSLCSVRAQEQSAAVTSTAATPSRTADTPAASDNHYRIGPRHVLDIAAGHGRYVLEALAAAARTPDSILLRDFSLLNVEAGRQLIATKDLTAIARFEQADAFDEKAIAMVDPKPTLGVVSGLYELFSDNALVRRSLTGLAAAIPSGGYLIYTGQPWHPQIEMIARALTSHRERQAWIMRRRTQAEMDQLVAAAGFRKLEQRIDEWGIFTVSLAVREFDPEVRTDG